MRTALLSFVSLLALACSAAPEAADSDESDLGKNIPATVLGYDSGYGGTLVYGTALPAQKTFLKTYTFFDLAGTTGDQVEIFVDGKGYDPILLVLGPRDPMKVAACEAERKWGAKYADDCLTWLPYPVIASNDDESTTSKNSRLKITLTSPNLRIAVAGAYSMAVTATNLASAIDSTACQPGVPDAGSFGPFAVVTRIRDCTGWNQCGPWREQGARQAGANLSVSASSSYRTLWLTDSGGWYRTVGHGLSDSGIATTRECTADTECSVSSGKTTCEAYERAVVLHNGNTALDSDTCTYNQISTPVWKGTIGQRCVSLSAGVTKTTVNAATRETEQVIVQSW